MFCERLELVLHLQTDYERRAEAACNVSFRNEERAVETMRDVNKLLIENILPSSVAVKFLSPDRQVDVRPRNPSLHSRRPMSGVVRETTRQRLCDVRQYSEF